MEVLKYNQLCKDVKVDFVKEYSNHLECLSFFEEFESMKLNWDLAYFKSIIQCQIKGKQPYKPPEIKDESTIGDLLSKG